MLDSVLRTSLSAIKAHGQLNADFFDLYRNTFAGQQRVETQSYE